MVALGAPLVLLIAYLYAEPEGLLAKALSLRPLVWLGERSYGFYLWHFPVSVTAHHLGIHRPVAGLLAVVVTVGLTELSWRLVERPFLKMKRRYT
jgi:peptidoglycan/LPS O-acetylase OafA/YrhL